MLHNNHLSALDQVYQYVITNPYSSFYRDLYGANRPTHISSLADWEALPVLTKEHIAAVPYAERLFTPPEYIFINRMSSGTSAAAPLVYPRSLITPHKNYSTARHTAVCALSCFTPHYLHNYVSDEVGANTISIAADIEHLEQSVAMAVRCGLDHILASISHLQLLTPHLISHNACEHIRHIDLSGESISPAQKTWLQETFPRATIGMLYGLTETQGIAGTCADITNEIRYRPTEGFMVETIADELHITHTITAHNCFPLLRYNTRDMALIRNDAGYQYFTITGRSTLDTIKVPGGAIMTILVEQALHKLHPHFSSEFELHYSPTPKPSIKLIIELKNDKSPSATELATLAETFAERLKISPNYTYKDGIQAELYNPVTITCVTKLNQTTLKKKRLFID